MSILVDDSASSTNSHLRCGLPSDEPQNSDAQRSATPVPFVLRKGRVDHNSAECGMRYRWVTEHNDVNSPP